MVVVIPKYRTNFLIVGYCFSVTDIAPFCQASSILLFYFTNAELNRLIGCRLSHFGYRYALQNWVRYCENTDIEQKRNKCNFTRVVLTVRKFIENVENEETRGFPWRGIALVPAHFDIELNQY